MKVRAIKNQGGVFLRDCPLQEGLLISDGPESHSINNFNSTLKSIAWGFGVLGFWGFGVGLGRVWDESGMNLG